MYSIEECLIDLVKAKNRYKELSGQIGDALSASTMAQVDDGVNAPVDWIARAYSLVGGSLDDDYGVVRCHEFHDNCADDYLGENCLHAQKAHRLIQERKIARKELGNAKRRVSLIARKLFNEQVRNQQETN